MTVKLFEFGSAIELVDPEIKLHELYGTTYYIAPEILERGYGKKCDLWSIGVILYTMTYGKPPFDGKTDRHIIRKVRLGHVDYKEPEGRHISEPLKHLLRNLLQYDESKRIDCAEAMNHEWIKMFAGKTDDQFTLKALKNLSRHNTQQKLQDAVISFIVNQLTSTSDIWQLQ